MAYFTLGVEPFRVAEVWGTHGNRRVAEQHAKFLEQNKTPLCCQNYIAMTTTEAKRKYRLYT